MDELELIEWLKKFFSVGKRRGVVVDIGDDSACVKVGRGYLLFTCDQVIDGIHFKMHEVGPKDIGRKAMARALSDIACMAGVPLFALATIAVPRHTSANFIKMIIKGLNAFKKKFGVEIIGGDISATKGRLGISVFVAGRTVRPITRSGAKAEDAIFVTGKLGYSLYSGKHLRFTPRIKEGLILGREFPVSSMIDISDGLLLDLYRICQASRVGAVLYEEEIPLAGKGASALEHALYDGEDYELLFTAPVRYEKRIAKAVRAKVIGRITGRQGIFLKKRSGELIALEVRGYVHRF